MGGEFMSLQRRITALRTTESFPQAQVRHLLIGAALALGLSCTGALADEQKQPAKPLDVKGTFRNICGFCHENYGRKAAKGPQLMNSERSDEFLFARIKNGMPGRMAAFGFAFTDDQIRQIVKFIRNLKPDQEPENP
jgi:mono/diheme cytochrome c family protein